MHTKLSVDPNLFETFMTVANVGKVAQAAVQMNLSQPAVTAKVRKLEAQLGVILFKRSAHGVELTAKGQQFYDQIRLLWHDLDGAIQKLSEQVPSGELTLGASTTIASDVLPEILSAFALRFEKIAIKLEVGNTEKILEDLRSGAVSVGLVEGLSKAPGIRLEPFVSDELVVVGAIKFKSQLKSITDLTKVPILWRESGSGTRAVIERALKKAGISKKQLSYQYEMASTNSIKSAACLGMGIAFLSRWSIQNEVSLGQLMVFSIPPLNIARSFHWALPGGGLGSANLFYEFACNYVSSARAGRLK